MKILLCNPPFLNENKKKKKKKKRERERERERETERASERQKESDEIFFFFFFEYDHLSKKNRTISTGISETIPCTQSVLVFKYPYITFVKPY